MKGTGPEQVFGGVETAFGLDPMMKIPPPLRFDAKSAAVNRQGIGPCPVMGRDGAG